MGKYAFADKTELCMIRNVLLYGILVLGVGCSSTPEGMKKDALDRGEAFESRMAEQMRTLASQHVDAMEGYDNVTRLDDERVPDSLIIVDDADFNIADADENRQSSSKVAIVIEKAHVVFKDIYFDFDHWEISEPMQARLADHAQWLKDHRASEVSIAGHCDVRGSREYNMVLGEKRAQRVKTFLMKSGVNGERISIISYGEERPRCLDETNACHYNNRRAHIELQ